MKRHDPEWEPDCDGEHAHQWREWREVEICGCGWIKNESAEGVRYGRCSRSGIDYTDYTDVEA